MSVSSLTRMTVPLASDQSAASQGLLMPKLRYRFRVIFENIGVTTPKTELTKQVIDFTRPTLTQTDVPVDIYNSKIYFAGKHEWSDLSVNLRDDASGNVTKIVGEQLQKQFDFMEQSSAASGIDYKFNMRCEMLDGGNGASTPNVLETWEFYGCFIKSVNYGEVSYSSSDPVTISLSIRFDNAVQTPIGLGIGSTVARTIGSVITG